MSKPKLCILSFSKIGWDARVLREVEAALPHYEVDVIGYAPWTPPAGARFFECPPTKHGFLFPPAILLILLGRLHPAIWQYAFWRRPEYQDALKMLRANRYDLIHANDWDGLPVAVESARGTGTKVLFDAHEYTPEQGVDAFRARLRVPFLVHLLKQYGAHADGMITVGGGIADLYKQNFGWQSGVVMNVPKYEAIAYRAVNPEKIHLIHHGAAARGRYLEDFIKMMALADSRYHLNLMLMETDAAYMAELRQLAEQVAAGRVSFHAPVSPTEIVRTIAQYDIGIPLGRVKTKTHYYALPNKFFDFIMAGLGICVTPLPEMARIVEENQNGVVSRDQSAAAMADALNGLTAEQINAYKRNSLELAKTLNAEVETGKLLEIYKEMLKTA